jgi:hypothetical protein
MTFVCDFCEFTTTRKNNLKQHLSKIKQCQNNKMCKYTREESLTNLYEETKMHVCICNNKYTQLCSLYRHQKQCNIYLNEKNKTEEQQATTSSNSPIINNSPMINNSTVTNSNNTNTNSTVNSHNTIIINNFGYENISYLTPELIEQCTCRLPDGLQALVKRIHLNINHPENHNVKVTNIQSPMMHVRKNDEWILQDKKDTLRLLIDKTADIQRFYFEDNKKGITERWNSYKRDAIEFYHERLDNEDKELWKKLMKDIYLMFCNNKEMFPQKRKRKPKQEESINDHNIVV